MEKKIEDYLHMYIGCDVLCPANDEKYKLTGVDGDTIYMLHKEGSAETTIEYIKPILRPLRSMTEEQFKKVTVDIFEFHANDYYKQNDCLWCRKTITKERLRMSFDVRDYNFIHYWTDFTPQENKLAPKMSHIIQLINWCRQNGFDMDGLIEAGLAIDSTKQL